MLSRSSSFASALADTAAGGNQPAQKTQSDFSRPVVGYWSKQLSDALIWRDSRTAYMASGECEGPVFRFPVRVVKVGESVILHVTFDACRRRGEAKHRPATRIMVRVKPCDTAPRDGGTLCLSETGEKGYYLGPRNAPVWLHKDTWQADPDRTDKAMPR